METFAFEVACTPCPAYEFGYNEHLAITSRFLCIIGLRVMIKCSVTTSIHLKRLVSFASFHSLWDQVQTFLRRNFEVSAEKVRLY